MDGSFSQEIRTLKGRYFSSSDGNSNMFVIFTPIPGGMIQFFDEHIYFSLFFKWVVQPPTSIILWGYNKLIFGAPIHLAIFGKISGGEDEASSHGSIFGVHLEQCGLAVRGRLPRVGREGSAQRQLGGNKTSLEDDSLFCWLQ